MKFNLLSIGLTAVIILLTPPGSYSRASENEGTFRIVTDFSYKMASRDSAAVYKALGRYGAKIQAVDLAAKYLTHKGLLENYGHRKKEIYCLTVDEVQAEILAEEVRPEAGFYYLKLRSKVSVSDFIKAEIKDLKLDEEEKQMSWQTEMEQPLSEKIDPAQELSRAYRYIRRRQWRIAVIYLDHLEKKYAHWSEVYLAKAIGYYGLHGTDKMKTALKTSCSLGNQEACDDLAGLRDVP